MRRSECHDERVDRDTPMKQKVVILTLSALLLALCVPVSAQQSTTIPRIGYLNAVSPSTTSDRIASFRQGLRELGYVEGKNIIIEYRYGEGKVALLPELAADLVRLKVDIIVAAGGTNVVRAVKNATKTIPIVMVGEGIDPVEARIVESLARPGGNITGLTNLAQT